jgi:hypothetical protein
MSALTPAAGAIRTTRHGVSLALTVVPRSSRDEVTGLAGETIRIRLTAPPVEGRANEALLSFLVRQLDVPHSALRITAGSTSRHKTVAVDGLTPDEVRQRLLPAAAQPTAP